MRETCEIALARIEWTKTQNPENSQEQSEADDIIPFVDFSVNPVHPLTLYRFRQFTSVDPAPPSSQPPPATNPTSQIDTLRSTLTSPTLSLFERYRAMFALRNIAGSHRPETEKAAVDALASGFSDDSELFKSVTIFFHPLLHLH